MQYIAKVSNTKIKLAIYMWNGFNISEVKNKKSKGKNIHSFIHSFIQKSTQCPVCLHGTLYNAHVYYVYTIRLV